MALTVRRKKKKKSSFVPHKRNDQNNSVDFVHSVRKRETGVFSSMNTTSLAVLPPTQERARMFVASGNVVTLPETFNYIGAFLTFRCPYACSYCINRFGNSPHLQRREIPARKWIDFFSRLSCRDVPITLQGGEPGVHRDFIDIVKETSKFHHVDILTNLAFDYYEFARKV